MNLFDTWIAAFMTLGILSFLYRDNPYFRFTEALFAGVSLGYYVGIVMDNTLIPNLFTPLVKDFSANYLLLLPAALGILLYSRYIPSIAWLGRFSLAAYIGYYAGVAMLQKLHGEVLPQIKDTFVALSGFGFETFNNLIVAVGVLSVLVYFFFSVEHKGVLKPVSKLGIYFIMLSFGAAFGYTVMGRISLLIGRMNFLVNDWIMGTVNAAF